MRPFFVLVLCLRGSRARAASALRFAGFWRWRRSRCRWSCWWARFFRMQIVCGNGFVAGFNPRSSSAAVRIEGTRSPHAGNGCRGIGPCGRCCELSACVSGNTNPPHRGAAGRINFVVTSEVREAGADVHDNRRGHDHRRRHHHRDCHHGNRPRRRHQSWAVLHLP